MKYLAIVSPPTIYQECTYKSFVGIDHFTIGIPVASVHGMFCACTNLLPGAYITCLQAISG